VLIVGGGPVGLTLAMDLAWRRIDVIVAEKRPRNDPPNVKCGQIGARSMEIFRRLGLAEKLRGIGLPADYPNDIHTHRCNQKFFEGAVRTRCGAAPHTHSASYGDHGIRAGRAGRDRERRRPRCRRAVND
jgi:2-polyprenyl-6-methoxyphenol hydroxylase-like FAD-dependent oxidoreductase